MNDKRENLFEITEFFLWENPYEFTKMTNKDVNKRLILSLIARSNSQLDTKTTVDYINIYIFPRKK